MTPLTNPLGSKGASSGATSWLGAGSGAGGDQGFSPSLQSGKDKTSATPGALSAMRTGELAITVSSSHLSY